MTGYEPECLYPLASSAQRVPQAYVLWVMQQPKWEYSHSKILEAQIFYLCCFRSLTGRFQVLKSFFQEVLSSRVGDKVHWLFSYCVSYTLCKKYGSDTYTIQRAIAGYFACITKTDSRWILIVGPFLSDYC